MSFIERINNYFNKRSDEKLINNVLQLDAKRRTKVVGDIFKRVKHKGLEYNGNISVRGAEFKPSEYDLNQIAAVIDIDSYLRRAIEKYVELILKNGFEFVGKNPNTIKYVRKRFEQIALVTDIPTNQLFEDICQQLVSYSNCFISKVRNENASGGKVRTTFYDKKLFPVAGYFVEDATSILIAKDQHGKIIKYKQYIPGIEISPEWFPEDMIHIYCSRKRGLSFGTPLCFPVIDDIKAVRKIEQNIEIVSHQNTIPVIQYKIGTPDRPGDPSEVAAVKLELENNPPYSCMVTTERHEIAGVDIKTNAGDITKLVEVFKKRIYAGLGVSPLVMGEQGGAGRQTAESLDRQMENTAEKYMKVIKTFVDYFIIDEILEEGGYHYDSYDQKNKVELYFPPINFENKNKLEEHLNNMYQGNLITESEARITMGRDPMSDTQRQDTNLHNVQIPLSLIKSIDEQYQEVTTKSPSGAMKKVKKPVSQNSPNQKIANKIANTAQPVNQHGKSLARPKIPKDSAFIKILSHYKATSDDLIMALEDGSIENGFNPATKISKKLIKENMEDNIRIHYNDGYKSVKNDGVINFNNNIRYVIDKENIFIDSYFENLNDKINKFIISENSKFDNLSLIQSIFSNYEEELLNNLKVGLLKSYNIGVVQAGIDSNLTKFNIFTENCKLDHKIELEISEMDYSIIPPNTKFCDCLIYIEEK